MSDIPALHVEHVPPAELKAHPRNYRRHPEDQIDHIVSSIEQHGFYRNIIAAQDGTVLGHHDGTHHFTIGQRKGLAVGTPAADGRPRYVLDISPVDNSVTVGPGAGLDVDVIETGPPVWAAGRPADTWRGHVQVRAHGEPLPARLLCTDTGVRVELDAAVRGVAPGQAAVFYAGDRVVGSGPIASRLPVG